jgi:chromosome partitioning protein
MGKTIAFLSQKGGVGKSTLARAVACEASKSGLSVRLADLGHAAVYLSRLAPAAYRLRA